VSAIGAYAFATFATRRSRFVCGKFVGGPFFMGGFSAFSRDFALPFAIH